MNGGKVVYYFEGEDKDISKKLDGIKSKIGSTASAIGKSVMVGATIATGALAGLTTSIVNAYGEYEQMMGGAELLYGKYADEVISRSKEVYATTGMSASEYLQQVNGFATGLKKYLKGDEKAAGKLADKIITAQADIVSATGQTQEAVQNAFNGVMRGNFTMLDNLQLGITPTKEGYESLIKEVNKWNKANGKATNYIMGNYADMEAALVDYVKMQGLSGYASREASTTIQGSFKAAKASFTNFITAIGSGDGVEEALEGLIKSVGNFGENVGKVVERALPIIAKTIPQIATTISQKLPTVINQLMPSIIQSIVSLINGVIIALPTLIQTLVPPLISGAVGLLVALVEALPDIIGVLADMLPIILEELINGLMLITDALIEQLPVLIPMVIDAVLQIIPQLINHLPEFISAGFKLLSAIIAGIINAVPILLLRVVEIIGSVVNYFKQVPEMMLTIGGDILKGLWNGIKNAKDWVLDKIKGICSSILDSVKSFFGIHSPSKVFAVVGEYNMLGLEKGMEDEQPQVQKMIDGMFDLNPNLSSSMNNTLSPQINVINNVSVKQDALGQMVSNIKTFSGGAKNDYNYGMSGV